MRNNYVPRKQGVDELRGYGAVASKAEKDDLLS